FCQAEDGIRDFHVTGVQTCALPIFSSFARCPVSSRTLGGSSTSFPRRIHTVRFLGDSPPCAELRSFPGLLIVSTPSGECRARPEIGRASCREKSDMKRVSVSTERIG